MAHDTNNLSGRELVLEVACDLFVQKGYDGVSMQQIADAAHMTKGSPYYHFKGKEDLFVHAFIHRVDQIHIGLIAALEGDAALRTRLIAGFAYILATTDSGVIRLIEDFQRVIGPERWQDYADRMITPDLMLDTWRNTFARAEEAGLSFRISSERAAWTLNALLIGTLHMHHVHGEGALSLESATDRATEAIDFFLAGIGATDAPAN